MKAISAIPHSNTWGDLGNVNKDGYYVAPWGRGVKCFILTDYGEPLLRGIIVGKHSVDIRDDFDKRHQANLKPKPHEVTKVEPRWVFELDGSKVADVHGYQRAQNERAEAWPAEVLAHLGFGEENAKSLEALGDQLGCEKAHVGLPGEKRLFPDKPHAKPVEITLAGEKVSYFSRGELAVFYREREGEQTIL